MLTCDRVGMFRNRPAPRVDVRRNITSLRQKACCLQNQSFARLGIIRNHTKGNVGSSYHKMVVLASLIMCIVWLGAHVVDGAFGFAGTGRSNGALSVRMDSLSGIARVPDFGLTAGIEFVTQAVEVKECTKCKCGEGLIPFDGICVDQRKVQKSFLSCIEKNKSMKFQLGSLLCSHCRCEGGLITYDNFCVKPHALEENFRLCKSEQIIDECEASCRGDEACTSSCFSIATSERFTSTQPTRLQREAVRAVDASVAYNEMTSASVKSSSEDENGSFWFQKLWESKTEDENRFNVANETVNFGIRNVGIQHAQFHALQTGKNCPPVPNHLTPEQKACTGYWVLFEQFRCLNELVMHIEAGNEDGNSCCSVNGALIYGRLGSKSRLSDGASCYSGKVSDADEQNVAVAIQKGSAAAYGQGNVAIASGPNEASAGCPFKLARRGRCHQTRGCYQNLAVSLKGKTPSEDPPNDSKSGKSFAGAFNCRESRYNVAYVRGYGVARAGNMRKGLHNFAMAKNGRKAEAHAKLGCLSKAYKRGKSCRRNFLKFDTFKSRTIKKKVRLQENSGVVDE